MLSLVECPPAVLRPTQAGDLVVLQRELVVVGNLFVGCDRLLRVDHNLFLGLDGYYLGVTVRLKEKEKRSIQRQKLQEQHDSVVKPEEVEGFGLTVQQWLMNRDRLPHFVASIIVSWSTLNR